MKFPASHPRAGFTLIELAICSVILVTLLGSLALFSGRSTDTLGTGTAQAELDARLRQTLARITDELLSSGFAVITPAATPPKGAEALTYRKSAGAVNGAIKWGSTQRLAFVYETGEVNDGTDNNGNGLVDEGTLEWTLDVGTPEERTVVLCHGVSEHPPGELENGGDDNGDGLVDEHGLSFERVGDALRVSLTLERLDPQKRLLTRTLATTVQPRN